MFILFQEKRATANLKQPWNPYLKANEPKIEKQEFYSNK